MIYQQECQLKTKQEVIVTQRHELAELKKLIKFLKSRFINPKDLADDLNADNFL